MICPHGQRSVWLGWRVKLQLTLQNDLRLMRVAACNLAGERALVRSAAYIMCAACTPSSGFEALQTLQHPSASWQGTARHRLLSWCWHLLAGPLQGADPGLREVSVRFRVRVEDMILHICQMPAFQHYQQLTHGAALNCSFSS